MAPSIDLVLPFYGDVGLLLEAVQSVRRQNHDDWQLLVLDDCSPDHTVRERIVGLADPRIRYERNDHNLGANGNYKKALSRATRDYVTVLGADDRLLTDYVSRAIEVLGGFAKVDVVQPGVRVIDDSGRLTSSATDSAKRLMRPLVREPRAFGGQRMCTSLMRGNWTYFPSLLWHRATIQSVGFRGYHVVQDLALLMDVLMRGGTLVVDPAVTFEYRRHAASDSSVKAISGARFAEERAFFDEMAAELAARGWHRSARAARCHLMSRLHAASLVPAAVRHRNLAALPELARQAMGW